MKILLITDLYPIIEDKTIPNAILDFAVGLKDFGEELCVFRPNFLLNSIIRKHKIVKNGFFEKQGIKIYNQNFIFPFFNAKNPFDIDFDLIISHMPSGHLCAYEMNKKLNLPHVAIIHQSDFEVLNSFKYSFYFKNALKKALNCAKIIGARNEFLKEKLNAKFLLPSYVLKENIVSKKEFNNEKLKIVTLSKLIKRKNLDKVILALSQAGFDFEYDIYGSGREEKKLKKLIKKYNLENKINLCGQIEHSKIHQTLDNYDIFILPSVNETFGISYLEALSRGLITIGVKNTGIDGVIKNYENGFLIEPRIDEIKEILTKISKMNSEEKEKISKNALQNIKDYEKNEIMTKYVDVIKKILWK